MDHKSLYYGFLTSLRPAMARSPLSISSPLMYTYINQQIRSLTFNKTQECTLIDRDEMAHQKGFEKGDEGREKEI